MMGDTKHETRAIFTAALALNAPAERGRYLDEACAGKPELRRRVEALLQAAGKAGAFLTQDALGGPLNDDVTPLSEGPGIVIGHYKLLEQIGEGGFGVVFMAEQVEPLRRKVALKIVKPGMDTKQVIARFEAERQALALMDHPNIARVFDAGATDSGRPYFVMELVRGVPLTRFCDANNLNPRERLKLFMTVCEAVQHAHQKGIIHRDLKPSNILVTLHDGRPVPKVIDFGTAKALQHPLTEKTLFTAYGKLIGTPQYMSPEQAEMSGLDVDTRADIYSLGVLLYELLTGTTPFEAERLRTAAFEEMMRIIRQEEPPKPSTRISILGERATEIAQHRQVDPALLRRKLQGDLDWIAMKCLEKERQRRYATVESLREDIQRHLERLPVLASPPKVSYRVRKLIQRHKAMTASIAAGSVALVLISFLAVLAAAYFRDQERQQRQLVLDKEEQHSQAREGLYFAHIRVAHQDWVSGQIPRVREILSAHVPQPGEPDLRGWEWYYLLSLCHREERSLRGHSLEIDSVSAHPAGRWLASAGGDPAVTIWNAETGELGAEMKGHEDQVRCVSWSPDGGRLASGGLDNKVILWDAGSLQKSAVLDCGREIWALAWSPDGKRLATGGILDSNMDDGLMAIWDVASGRELRSLPGHGIVWSLAWHPGGRVLVSGGNIPGNLEVWDPGTGQLLKTIKAHAGAVWALAWSPEGRRLASAGEDQRIRIWDADSWVTVRDIDLAHAGAVKTVAWSADGMSLASGGSDRLVKLWDAQTGSLLNTLRGHEAAVASVCWWPKHELLISGGAREDGRLIIWRPTSEQAAQSVPGHAPFAWSPDGAKFAVAALRTNASDPAVIISVLDAASQQPLSQLRGPTNVAPRNPSCLAWSPKGQRLAAGFAGGRLQVWDLADQAATVTIAGTNYDDTPWMVAWSPDEQLLLTTSGDSMARIWNVETKDCILTYRGHCKRPRNPLTGSEDHADVLASACWHPDGRRIASEDQGGGVTIWEAATGRILHRLWCAGGGDVAFSPRGDMLAAGSGDGRVMIWDAETWRNIYALRGHTSDVGSVSWSPDGRRLASGSADRTVRIWDARSGRELLVLACPQNSNPGVFWSPDGRRIGIADDVVQILDADLGYQLATSMPSGVWGK